MRQSGLLIDDDRDISEAYVTRPLARHYPGACNFQGWVLGITTVEI